VALYTSDSRDRVREAVDFVELVSTRTELRRAGPSRYEGLCPFHDERTPSFGIDPVQKVYHCFGCGASGDVFTFVQETEGIDFKAALELLAERYHVKLEREAEDAGEAERRKRRERLYAVLARTAAFYARYLWEAGEAQPARAYLAGRGLEEAILREFAVGFAPHAWDRVLAASKREGYSEQELLEAGLAQRSRESGRTFDRFRGRIMFPLTDGRGRVIGFGARAMGDEKPKYLNSADGEIYHKGRNLYGAHIARQHAAKAGRVILCEGYTDVIAMHQAGLRETVGLMGTALTAEQVAELGRMAPVLVLALDADSAGQGAMERAATLAADRSLELQVAPLPAGSDPADLVAQRGAQAAREAFDATVPFVRFRVERIVAAGDAGSPEGRDKIVDALRPVFAAIPVGATRLDLTRFVAGRLDLTENLVAEMLAAPRGQRRPAGAGRLNESVADPTEIAFLALCAALGEPGQRELAQLDLDELFAGEPMRRLARLLVEHGTHGIAAAADPELAPLVSELLVTAAGEPPDQELLRLQRYQLELAALERRIRRSRAGAGEDSVSELAQRRDELKQTFDRAYSAALEDGR